MRGAPFDRASDECAALDRRKKRRDKKRNTKLHIYHQYCVYISIQIEKVLTGYEEEKKNDGTRKAKLS